MNKPEQADTPTSAGSPSRPAPVRSESRRTACGLPPVPSGPRSGPACGANNTRAPSRLRVSNAPKGTGEAARDAQRRRDGIWSLGIELTAAIENDGLSQRRLGKAQEHFLGLD
ncbi:hypothetical protein B0H17DRAFT_1037478 [Mycena rosella]|uniref:Uncharacterized protein n=1 Tax=Mycena rosella TaxID=1033263 RepID=A0AAD7GTY3_MYCRO|nr:hypothetical protein B0H17DRAFT_1037478 [Mycena rosella]